MIGFRYARISFYTGKFYNGIGQIALLPATVIPLWPTLERVAGAAEKCPSRSGAPKSFNMIAFQSFS